ncbi:MAG: hypothetical protein IKI45_09125 [Oscillospiraceae bacterium]|nr:hypothetical protein [Oscillospiraceae bacterium]
MTDSEKITSSILYQNDNEKQATRRKCIADTIIANKKYQGYTVDQIMQFMKKPDSVRNGTKDYEIASDFTLLISMEEKINVFKMACERFGYKLWRGRAWQNKACKRSCPLADFCRKETVVVDGERLCRGQIYCNGLMADALPDSTPVLNTDGSVDYLKSDDPESFGIFFDILFDVGSDYGDPKSYGNHLIGGNVIQQLYKTALNEKDEH